MTGLIHKNLLAGNVSAFTIIFITIVAAVAGFIVRIPDAHLVASFAISGAFITTAMFHFHRKDDANWQMLETTMPMKLAFIELSRYLSFFTVLAMVLMAIAIYTLTNYLSGVISELSTAVAALTNSFMMVSSFYFLYAAIQFPALRFLSAKNSVAISYGCFIVTFVIFFITVQIASRLPQTLQDIGHWPFAAGTFILLVLSYFVSVRVYRRRCST